MSLAAPLGFLGLLGLGALILIYLLKPNYQQKLVSSTFVWKLSLKYKKKKVPISRIRNIIILICQILIIVLCAFIMASPVTKVEADIATEKVAIIDASASMLAKHDDKTRYERAVAQCKELATQVLSESDGVFSVVLASDENEVIIQRADSSMIDEVTQQLDALLTKDDDGVLEYCTFGVGDVNGAVSAAEEIVFDNDNAEIVLFTGTTYIEKSGITIVNVSEAGEWNAAILNCTATLEDGYYKFEVDVACYGADRELTVSGTVHGANREKIGDDWVTTDVFLSAQRETFIGDNMKTLVFTTVDEITGVYTFEDVYFRLEGVDDSFTYDNFFYLYNGNADSRSIKVQYCSSSPNSFIPIALSSVRNTLRVKRDINITLNRTGIPVTEGYDLYIFEHTMPTDMPIDGVVMMINPDQIPRGIEVSMDFRSPVTGDFWLAPGNAHPLTEYLDLTTIYVSKYTRITGYDESFEPVLYCGGDPIMLVKNDPDSKVVILPLSLNYSTLPGIVHLSTIFRNLFNYYLPITITSNTGGSDINATNVFSVNEEIKLRARGTQLVLSGGGLYEVYNMPAGYSEVVKISRSGTYTVTQEIISGITITDNFFVQIPNSESYITKEADIFVTRIDKETKNVSDRDLIIYFAAVMVLLLVAEWWLHSRELKV